MDDFLISYEFGKEFAAGESSAVRDFRVRCREFIDPLVVLIVKSISVTNGVSRCLYRFGPEIFLEGEDSTVFGLFALLCCLTELCEAVCSDKSNAAVEAYPSYVVEKRRQHLYAELSASDT